MLKLLQKISCLGFALLFILLSVSPVSAQVYSPISPSKLEKEIRDWATPTDGSTPASAVLVWQYSGERGTGQEFGNDKYSFFRNIAPGPAICKKMNDLRAEFAANGVPTKLGVNMWDATDAKHSETKVTEHFKYLKESCGTDIVRVFAKSSYPDGSGVTKVINAVQSAGIQVIIAIGDYSNGGGGMPQGAPGSWYGGGYESEYLTFAQTVKQLAAGRGGVYGLELANEPHCGNDANILPAYINWVNTMAAQLAGTGKIGIGQMGNAGGACDNPDDGSFTQSNSSSNIQMASAHYYTAEDKEMALRARKATPSGKEFYIGELGWGADEELDPEDYYLYNIKGLATGDATALLNDLIDQGYQAHCSTPKVKVEAEQGGQIAQFMNFVGDNPSLAANYPNTKSVQTFNYTNARVPLLRDENPIAALYNSLEDFFGFQSVSKDPENIQKSIESAPLFTMMTLKDQCRYKVRILETIESLCGQLDDPATCALYQPIPEMPDFNTRDLLSAYRSQGSVLSCENVYGSKAVNLTEEQQNIMMAIQSTPLYLEKSFRLAFLVIVTDLLPDEPNSFFNFLNANGSSTPAQSVKVLAFKIPDFGTTRKDEEQVYIDPLQTTRNLLLSPYDVEVVKQKVAAEKQALRNAGSSGLVTCGTEDCRDPLVRSVVELVNRSSLPACDASTDDLKYEPVNQIYSRGTLISNDGTQFADGADPAGDIFKTGADTSAANAEAAAQTTTTTDNTNSPQLAVFNFLSNIRLGLRTGKPDTTIRSYLVMPVGAELSTAEIALMSYFDPDWTQNYATNSDENKYYRLADVDQRMQGGKVEHKFFDGSDPAYIQANCSTPGAIYPDCALKKATLEVTADQEDHAPRIPFGGIGYITRKIQETVNRLATAPRDFLASITTTEEWLLQNGKGGNPTAASDSDTQPLACQNYQSQTIDIPTQDELVDKVYQYAQQNNINPQLLWGILQIEGSPLLRAMRAGKTSMSCGDTINTCGATGPLQIIQGSCVSSSCNSPLTNELKKLQRPNNICSVDGSLAWAASTLNSYKSYPDVQAALARLGQSELDYLLAAKYTGLNISLFDQSQCRSTSAANSASPVSGCNGLNYCQCAVDGFTIPAQ